MATRARARTSPGIRSIRSSSLAVRATSRGCAVGAPWTNFPRCWVWLTSSRVEPIRDSARFYRRWAFESAALDLALRQNGLSLQDAVGRVAKPVTFVVSLRVGHPASLAPVRALRRVDPGLHFKLDPSTSWDDDLLAE